MATHRHGGEFAVAYDVSDDRERRRVDRVLSGFGFRIQKSVFECRLTPAGQRALLHELEALRLKTGSVKVYRVHASSQARVIGLQLPTPDAGFAFTL
jgi:CRISPR-associated protein Cas2